jgi:iron-sulfur cluster assembly accessory protein
MNEKEDRFMITISDVAAEKIVNILKEENKEGWGLRLFLDSGGCCPSLGLDLVENALEGDKTVEHNNAKVFLSKEVIPSVQGMTLDFVDNGEQQGFGLTGGQPSDGGSSCGPGCSTCG